MSGVTVGIICTDMLLCLQRICLYQVLVGTHPSLKMMELGTTFLLLSKQIIKKKFKQQRIMGPDEFYN